MKGLEEIVEKESFWKRSYHKTRLFFSRHPLISGLFGGGALYATESFLRSHGLSNESIYNNIYYLSGAGFVATYWGCRLARKKLSSQLIDKEKDFFSIFSNHVLGASFLLTAAKIHPLREFISGSMSTAEFSASFGMSWASLFFPMNVAIYYARPRLLNFIQRRIFDWPKLRKRFKKTGDKKIIESFMQTLAVDYAKGIHSPHVFGLMAKAQLQLGNIDEAFMAYGRLFESKFGSVQVFDFNSPAIAWFTNNIIARPYHFLRRKLGKWGIEDDIEKAYTLLHYDQNVQAAKGILEKALERNTNTGDLLTLIGLFLSSVKHPEAEAHWDAAIDYILSTQPIETIGETTSRIYCVGPSNFLKNTFVFKEKSSLEALTEELKMGKLWTSILGPDKIVQPIMPPRQYGGKAVYAMRRFPGRTLLELLEEGATQHLELVKEIIGDIAKLHAGVESSRLGRLRLAHKLKAKLMESELRPQLEGKLDYRRIVKKIIKNYRPVYNTFKDSVWGINQDAHGEQFIVSDLGAFIRVDTEDKGFVPVQFDLVNLLEYGNNFSHEQKKSLILHYIVKYNQSKTHIWDGNDLMLKYYNAVIQRAVSLVSAWSSPDRRTMWPQREEMMNSAINAIGFIEAEHCEYYLQYPEYTSLREALTEIKTALAGS